MIKPASTSEEVADAIYETSTDNKVQLRYFAGKSLKAIYDRRREIGSEASRTEIKQLYFDEPNA